MNKFLVLAAGLALAACKSEPVTTAQNDTCGAQALQNLVGKPENALDSMKFDTTVRIIHPKDAVTMDLRTERLNIDIDANGVIAAVRCG